MEDLGYYDDDDYDGVFWDVYDRRYSPCMWVAMVFIEDKKEAEKEAKRLYGDHVFVAAPH